MRQVALVTGGAVRVGRAIALGLAEAGYDLVVNYHSSEKAAEDVVRRVERMGRRAVAVRADISDEEDVAGLVGDAEELFGRLDLLVNNASLFPSADLLEVEAAAWDRVMAVNLKGPFLVVREAAELLRSTRGSIVNILDLSAFRPFMEHPHHSVSKAGLLHLTRIMARTLAPTVRVNAIAPGTVLPPDGATTEEVDGERRRTALGRLGSPEDVVRTVLFLAGSPFITGEVIVVDGGQSLG